jgi:uncharacterized protein (DUF1330 family)
MAREQEVTDRPAFLVVIATTKDPVRMAAYTKALREAGLYERHGGHYEFLGAPAVDLENWDPGQRVVCARFPSRAAAEAFWYDVHYQTEIKPIRAGAADVHVAIYEAADSVTVEARPA